MSRLDPQCDFSLIQFQFVPHSKHSAVIMKVMCVEIIVFFPPRFIRRQNVYECEQNVEFANAEPGGA